MNTKKIVMVLGIIAILASSGARAGQEAKYKPLLKELNVAMCTIQNPKAGNRAMAKAQQDMVAINNKLSRITMKLSGAELSKFYTAKRESTTNCKVTVVSTDYKPLLKKLRKNTCVLMSGGSPAEGAKAAAANDKIKKELKPIERSLKANNKKAYGKYKKERSNAEMGVGC